MIRFVQTLIIIVIGTTCLGCKENPLLELAKNNPAMDVKVRGDLEFIYQVTDMEGNPSHNIKEGENFLLSFIVKNHGEKGTSIGLWSFPGKNDFFAVYKKSNEGGGNQYVGKSFRAGGNTKDGGHQSVPSKGEIEYCIPWLTQMDTAYIMPEYRPETNAPNRYYMALDPLPTHLSVGEYHSGFTLEYNETEIPFAISFTVK